uniref:Neprilysin n=1 Tax=Bursaphelenchus xylophilus TaxID=6326 RepID=A0A1I7S2U7_BURXY
MARISAHFNNYGVNGILSTGIHATFQRSDNVITVFFGPTSQLFLLYTLYQLRYEWEQHKPALKESLMILISKVAKVLAIQVDLGLLNDDVENVLRLEKFFIDNVFTDRTDPVDYVRDYEELTPQAASKEYSIIDFDLFLSEYIKDASDQVKAHVRDPSFKILIETGSKLNKVQDFLQTSVDGRTIYNYLFIRLALNFQRMLLSVPTQITSKFRDGGLQTEKKRRLMKDNANDVQTACNSYVIGNVSLELLYDRWFIEAALPIPEDRKSKIAAISRITENIINGFAAQISQLDWTEKAKEKAIIKLKNMRRNLVYPPIVFNDTLITEAYANYKTDQSRIFSDELYAIAPTMAAAQKEALLIKERGRDEFPQVVCNANAGYLPTRNSINIFAGILQLPIFDADFPLAVLYGAVGTVIGHEIVHGFDTSGVQFDEEGYVAPWLDQESQKSFDEMKTCIIDQFNKINTSIGLPVNGSATVGENIADSGGTARSWTIGETEKQEPYKSFTGGRNNEIEQGNGQVVVANGGNKLLPGIPVSLSSAVFLLKTVPISILDTCNMRKVIWRS